MASISIGPYYYGGTTYNRYYTLTVNQESYSASSNSFVVSWTLSASGDSTCYDFLLSASVAGSNVYYREGSYDSTGWGFPAAPGSTSGTITVYGGGQTISFGIEGYAYVHSSQSNSSSLTLVPTTVTPVINSATVTASSTPGSVNYSCSASVSSGSISSYEWYFEPVTARYTTVDYIRVGNYIGGTYTPTDYEMNWYDVNRDGVLDVTDQQMIRDSIMGIYATTASGTIPILEHNMEYRWTLTVTSSTQGTATRSGTVITTFLPPSMTNFDYQFLMGDNGNVKTVITYDVKYDLESGFAAHILDYGTSTSYGSEATSTLEGTHAAFETAYQSTNNTIYFRAAEAAYGKNGTTKTTNVSNIFSPDIEPKYKYLNGTWNNIPAMKYLNGSTWTDLTEINTL